MEGNVSNRLIKEEEDKVIQKLKDRFRANSNYVSPLVRDISK
ncbi:hypothetical protein [Fusobacterium necrophorum]|nr:hypothetical protein [Fusobacterium necrophorum]